MITQYNYELTIGVPTYLKDKEFAVYTTQADNGIVVLDDAVNDEVTAITITDSQISLEYEQNTTSKTNTGKLRIYNPPSELVNLVTLNKNVVVRWKVGNNVVPLEEVILCTVSNSHFDDSNNDHLLELTLADGSFNTRNSKFSGVFPRNTSYASIIEALAKHLRLPLAVALPSEAFTKTLTAPQTLVGHTSELLTRFSEAIGCDYNILNSQIYVLPKQGGQQAIAVPDLDFTSGLLTKLSPKFVDKGDKVRPQEEQERWLFECLLNPSIRPNSWVKVNDGSNNSGNYYIKRVVHIYDHHNGKHHQQIEAVKQQ